MGNSRQNVCKLNQIFRKLGKFGAKMFNILAKWLHYLWIFPNIRGFLINLLHLCGIFPKIREIHIKIHTFDAIYIFFSIHNYNKYNYNMMSFLGHPVCRLGLIWCILLGLFIFLALATCSCYLWFPLETNKVKNAFKYLIPMRTKSCITKR